MPSPPQRGSGDPAGWRNRDRAAGVPDRLAGSRRPSWPMGLPSPGAVACLLHTDLPQHDGGRAGAHQPGRARATGRDARFDAPRDGGDRVADRAGRDHEPGGRACARGRPAAAGRSVGGSRDRAGRSRSSGRRPGGIVESGAVDAGRRPIPADARTGWPVHRAGPRHGHNAAGALAGAGAGGRRPPRRCHQAARLKLAAPERVSGSAWSSRCSERRPSRRAPLSPAPRSCNNVTCGRETDTEVIQIQR